MTTTTIATISLTTTMEKSKEQVHSCKLANYTKDLFYASLSLHAFVHATWFMIKACYE